MVTFPGPLPAHSSVTSGAQTDARLGLLSLANVFPVRPQCHRTHLEQATPIGQSATAPLAKARATLRVELMEPSFLFAQNFQEPFAAAAAVPRKLAFGLCIALAWERSSNQTMQRMAGRLDSYF